MEKVRIRKRDTHLAVAAFCKARGGGLTVGTELEFDPRETNERGQDFWFGFNLVNWKGATCGEASVGYFRRNFDISIYASIVLDGEMLAARSITIKEFSTPNHRDRRIQPRELKLLLIEVAEDAARKVQRP
ncbi:TPA: hypothetical protein QDB31_005924 [Burkholderia vietnamiensis]|nr:hypothetical protein [Burkholderia vietnamiensis]